MDSQMATVTTPLTEQAESIFTELGYTVSNEGTTLRAERKWRVVHVTPVTDPDGADERGEFHCFVTWKERAEAVRDHLSSLDLSCEWAVIGVDEGGDYEVYRGPAVLA
jgi:hypothetical protein